MAEGELISFTVFTNSLGRLTKHFELDPERGLVSGPAPTLADGTFKTRSLTFAEFAATLTSLSSDQALGFGIATGDRASGRIVTVAAADAMPTDDAIARTRENFDWPSGAGGLMFDFDLKDAAPHLPKLPDPLSIDELRKVLISAVPQLANFPMIGWPSASACLYRADTGEELRGITGARFYVPVERAADIPALGAILHQRLMLAGYGFPFISKAGLIRIRSILDASVWSPERLDYAAGASCGAGIVQNRGMPQQWNIANTIYLSARLLPELSADERGSVAALTAALTAAALPLAEQTRAEFVEAERMKGRVVSATWRPEGGLDWLDGENEVTLAGGRTVTVDEILAAPSQYHERNCADPLEPDYRDDQRIARIYTRNQTSGPTIHSYAHGGVTYMLRGSAAADFPIAPGAALDVDAQQLWLATATEYERLAAILGNEDRVFLRAMSTTSGEGTWELWDRLYKATKARDPLANVFRRNVIDIAQMYRSLASDLTAFEVAVSARLESGAATKNLPSDDRRLLRLAAWIFTAPPSALIGQTSGNPIPLRRPGEGTRAAREWLVEGWLPLGGVGALVGPPGNGKSWIAADLCCRVATAPRLEELTLEPETINFAGRPATHGSVLYLGSEDVDGWSERADRQLKYLVESGRAQDGVAPRLFVGAGVPPLSVPSAAIRCIRGTVQQMRDAGSPAPVLIIVDVLRAATLGDENSSEAMGLAMATAHAIARMTGAFVLLLHHSAVSDAGRARGSGAIEGALDFEATVGKQGDTFEMTVKKNKGGPAGDSFKWHIQDGVLHEGADSLVSITPLPVGRARAVAAGQLIRTVASESLGISKTELSRALFENRPELVCQEECKAGRLCGAACTARRHRCGLDRGAEGQVLRGQDCAPSARVPRSRQATWRRDTRTSAGRSGGADA